MVGLGGGALVAVFEVAYQYAIAGAGVAGAAALLYTAPVIVAILAQPLLGEAITPLRVLLAVAVMVGATLTVRGGSAAEAANGADQLPGVAAGALGGALAALSYAGTTANVTVNLAGSPTASLDTPSPSPGSGVEPWP